MRHRYYNGVHDAGLGLIITLRNSTQAKSWLNFKSFKKQKQQKKGLKYRQGFDVVNCTVFNI